MAPLPLSAAVVIAACILLVAHWLPVSRLIPERYRYRPACLIGRYVQGVAAVGVAHTWYWLSRGMSEPVVLFWLFFGLGGLVVLVAYGLDWLADVIERAQTNEEIADECARRSSRDDA